MPVYEYECSRGHRFEAEQRIADEPLTTCRVWQRVPGGLEQRCISDCRRVISRTSFTLKGSGWAKDGYSGG